MTQKRWSLILGLLLCPEITLFVIIVGWLWPSSRKKNPDERRQLPPGPHANAIQDIQQKRS